MSKFELYNMLWQQLEEARLYLISLLVLLSGLVGTDPIAIGAPALTAEADILSEVSTLQDDYFLKNGDYFTALNKDDSEFSSIDLDKDTQTIRYKHLGSLGFYTIIEWDEGGYRRIKSTGYGVLASDKSWEYSRLLGVASSTTP